MLGLETPVLLFLFAYSVAATLGSNWLTGRLAGKDKPRAGRLWSLSATAIWIVILFVAGAIAVRYVERLESPILGYVLSGSAGILLSLLRTRLYRPVEEGHQPAPPLTLAQVIHTTTSILFAYVLYLLLHWLLGRSVELLLLVPLGVGTMLAELDSNESLPGRLLPFVSRRLERWLGSGQGWHSLTAALLIAIVSAPFLLLVPGQAWKLLPIGFVTHLLFDLLGPRGAMLLWPLRRTLYQLPGPPVRAPGSIVKRRLAVGLGLMAILLLLLVDVGPPPTPPVIVPSYEQILDRYYGLRGRNLVFASVQGTWQTTGQRISGRFEILNAHGTSYIMLDRYTGRIFTAGRNAADSLYLNYIDLQTGEAATVKPAEVQLRDETLAEALPVVYQMQREPGLQYIYVSGELVLPTSTGSTQPELGIESAPTELDRIQMVGDRRYSVQYLNAAQLIALARLEVESADLIVFATYVTPATGPTATPLPPAPASGQAIP
jgi:hypothetical protein